MRVIAGTRKGLKLASAHDKSIRPTKDSVKEVIFNVLQDSIRARFVLDLFAGTGSLGIESLSRGAARAIFVDHSRQAQRTILKNLLNTEFLEVSEVIKRPVDSALAKLSASKAKFDLVLADPPYDEVTLLNQTLARIVDCDVMVDGGTLVVEHRYNGFPHDPSGRLTLKSRRHKGDSEISFYRYDQK